MQPPRSGGVMQGVGVIVRVGVLVAGAGFVGVGVRVGVLVLGTELVGVRVGVLVIGTVVAVGGSGVSVSSGLGVRVGVRVGVAVYTGVGEGVEVAGRGPAGGYKLG